MKAIIFIFSLLFALVHPSYSKNTNPINANNFGIIPEISLHLPDNVRSENLVFNDFLIETDNDDLNDIVRNYLHFGKTAFKTLSFIAPPFSDELFKRNCLVRNFLNFSQPIFISIKVLKI